MIRLLNQKKILTFQIQGQRKTPGGIITSYGGVYDYFDCEPVWFAKIGTECQLLKEGVKIGDMGIILDAFEHEIIPGQWEECQDMPEFAYLKQRALEVEGEITASVIHENSLIAWFTPTNDRESGQRLTIGRGQAGEFFVG